MNQNLTNQELTLEQIAEQIAEGTYRGYINQGLAADASLTDRLKYQLCKEIVTYYRHHDLIFADLAAKLNLEIKQVKDILYCYLDRLELNELAQHTDRLLAPRAASYQTG
jgi:hypothetical protein